MLAFWLTCALCVNPFEGNILIPGNWEDNIQEYGMPNCAISVKKNAGGATSDGPYSCIVCEEGFHLVLTGDNGYEKYICESENSDLLESPSVCPECPACPTFPPAPTCPPIPTCAPIPECPTCAPIPECPTCAPIPECPTCPECDCGINQTIGSGFVELVSTSINSFETMDFNQISDLFSTSPIIPEQPITKKDITTPLLIAIGILCFCLIVSDGFLIYFILKRNKIRNDTETEIEPSFNLSPSSDTESSKIAPPTTNFTADPFELEIE